MSWKGLHWKCKLYNSQCISFDDDTHSSNAFFLRRYGHWSKYREGSWSYPVATGNPKKEALVLEEHIKKLLFDVLLFVMKLSCYSFAIQLTFLQMIARLEIKMPDCADSQWYVWVKKNIECPQYVSHKFQKRGVAGLHARGGYQEGGMIPSKLCWWCGIWSL